MAERIYAVPVVELVAVLVGGHNVEQQDVLGGGVQPRQAELHLGKHLPEYGRRRVSTIQLYSVHVDVYGLKVFVHSKETKPMYSLHAAVQSTCRCTVYMQQYSVHVDV